MKKIIGVIIALLLITACTKNDANSITKRFSDDINNANSYALSAKMSIVTDEEQFNYVVNVKYLKDNYFKVNLKNIQNGHEQVILRNKDGVYVITPSLNKSYKFESVWPYNSSQSYLPNSLLKDMLNDKKTKYEEKDNMYIIKSKVNYPNNEELTNERIYFDNKMNLKKVIVYDNDKKERIIVEFDKIDYKANIKEDDFTIDEYINNKDETKCENDKCDENVSNILDDIIYPLYLPNNTFLTSSETVDNDGSKRVILTFAGDKDFTIVEQRAVKETSLDIEPVFGEPIMLNDVIGVVENNSIKWTSGNVSYYLASNKLSTSEMISVASSMNASKSVMESK